MGFLSNEEEFSRYGYYLVLLAALASAIVPKFMHSVSYVAIAFALLRYYKFKVGIKPDRVIMSGIIAFLTGLLIASSFAPNWPKGYSVVEYFFKIMWPFLITSLFVSNRRQLVGVITVLAISIAGPSGYAIFQGLSGEVRAGAHFSHVNRLAFFLDIYIPLLYVATIEKNILPRKCRIFTGAVLAVAIPALVYTGTRGAWLAVGLTFMAYALLKIRDNKKLGIALCLVFVILASALLSSEPVRDRFATIFNPQFSSNSERVLIWESAVAMWRDYPLTGVGLDNFEKMEEIYLSPLHKEPIHTHAHNIFLNFLAETGLVGLSGFLGLFACILCRLARHSRNPLMTAAILITCNLLLHGLVDNNFYHQASMQAYWFVLGLSIASVKILADNG
ncbi:MAG TPA: O-antigen ligase family protein [Selenomonadales bacterium]|nr:O-antigen ligase family protein [Selenomonadales bacterium]